MSASNRRSRSSSRHPRPWTSPSSPGDAHFLDWIGDNHFTFLGYREYELLGDEGDERLRSVGGSGLGLLREAEPRESAAFASLSPEIRRLAREPHLLIITKANARATVHRPGYLDYIGVKKFDEEGRVCGERRFLGLYTSAAYNQVPRAIPLLREKVARVMERATYPSNSHAAKALLHILETFPRDLLFQVSDDELFETGMGILHLQERQRIRLFVHRDRIGRFVSCIVYVPRERFNTQVRLKIQNLLAQTLGARDVDFTVHLSESVLARLYFVFRVPPAQAVAVDVDDLEVRLSDYTRDWRDDLYEELLDHCGEELGVARYRRYGEAFSADYQSIYSARVAVHDIDSMEELGGAGDAIAMSLYRPLEAAPDVLHFKLFRPGRPISLSDALPVLEDMGLVVETGQPARIERADGSRMWMHDFGMRAGESLEVDIDRVRAKFQEAFKRIWAGEAENDGFNRLVLRAGLGWREIAVLRAYCKYLRQAGTTFSQEYMESALGGNTSIAQALVRLFPHPLRSRPFRGPRGARASSRRGDSGCTRGGGEPRRGSNPAEFPRPDSRDLAHQLLPVRGERGSEVLHVLQIRSRPDRRAPGAATDVRDLRVLPARGRRASARRGRWRGAASAGRTGARTSAPKCWAS